MTHRTKKYTNEDITVVWQPDKCIHSTICFNGLPAVFNPTKRPWVKIENSTTEKTIEQVKQCPSGALLYYSNKEKE